MTKTFTLVSVVLLVGCDKIVNIGEVPSPRPDAGAPRPGPHALCPEGRPTLATCRNASALGLTITALSSRAWNDTWAVTSTGVILHSDGNGWRRVDSGTTVRLNAVWVVDAADVWAAGDGGLLLRWLGSAWAPTPSGTTQGLRGVWGAAANDVWAVG
ncbi:MAG: hypothetical protein JNK82_29205, partial [Myxococcaceae bacterium]|nr:hypothetical protein [Myxococcaceae bacterium]